MTLSEQFARSRGRPIQVAGHSVHAIYVRKAGKGLTMRIRWRRAVQAPVQGVSISVNGGTLQIDDVRAKDLVLWTDTAPEEVTLKYMGRQMAELSLWNCWRDSRTGGVTQAWVGNSGMIVEEIEAGVIRYRCNSRPEISFEDLVFDAIFAETT